MRQLLFVTTILALSGATMAQTLGPFPEAPLDRKKATIFVGPTSLSLSQNSLGLDGASRLFVGARYDFSSRLSFEGYWTRDSFTVFTVGSAVFEERSLMATIRVASVREVSFAAGLGFKDINPGEGDSRSHYTAALFASHPLVKDAQGVTKIRIGAGAGYNFAKDSVDPDETAYGLSAEFHVTDAVKVTSTVWTNQAINGFASRRMSFLVGFRF